MSDLQRFHVGPVPEDYPGEGVKLVAEIAQSVVEEAERFVVKSLCTFLGQQKETEMYSVDKQKLIDAVRMYYHDPNVAQVVRCKDCKYSNFDNWSYSVCGKKSKYHNFIVEKDDFCNFGAKREDENART